MEYTEIEALREQHPAWRLLRAQHAPLVLGFLGEHFVEQNSGPTPASGLVDGLDDYLYERNAAVADEEEPPFPRSAKDYLDQWSDPDSGWLRRFYPLSSDDVHYDATPALEKAYAWVAGLRSRTFVGTESRLHTVMELLRQIVEGSDQDPETRLTVLRRQQEELAEQVAAAEAGEGPFLSDTAVRERYQQFSGTARELLSDFREVEENFRALDRAARERIAAWNGSKGELLQDLVASRADISGSDQGSSFQAFYDFLLSESRQDELGELIRRVQLLPAVRADARLRTIHHDWAEAAERTQQTVRQLSEQLRRFLDDQVWLENRRVLDLVKKIEATALLLRDAPPDIGLRIDQPGVEIALPFERPLYDANPAAEVDSMISPNTETEVDVSALFAQTFVDQARLAGNVRAVLPERSTTTLAEIIGLYPVEQGLAEIVGYLSLTDEDLVVSWDEGRESVLDYADLGGHRQRVRLPQVLVSRR